MDGEDDQEKWTPIADYDGKEFYILHRHYPTIFIRPYQKGWRNWLRRARNLSMRLGLPYIRLPWERDLTGIVTDVNEQTRTITVDFDPLR